MLFKFDRTISEEKSRGSNVFHAPMKELVQYQLTHTRHTNMATCMVFYFNVTTRLVVRYKCFVPLLRSGHEVIFTYSAPEGDVVTAFAWTFFPFLPVCDI